MKYQESKERSYELLRLTIARMSQQAAPFHPYSYALWYEYVSGHNPDLQAAVDKALQAEPQLTDATLRQLHQKHIVDTEAAASLHAGVEFHRLLGDLGRQTEQAGQQIHQYGSSLSEWQGKIAAADSPEALSKTVDGLLNETQDMSLTVSSLTQQLHDNLIEVATLKEELAQSRNESMTDALTGLINRRGFEQTLDGLLAFENSAASLLCVVLVNIDNFSKINDMYGHVFGDKVLRTIGQAIRVSLGKGASTIARLEGDSFAAILPSVDIAQAYALAEQLRSAVATSKIRKSSSGNEEYIGGMTLSAGVVSHQPPHDMNQLMHRAQLALQQSKQMGRDRVSLLEDHLQQSALPDKTPVKEMRMSALGRVGKIQDY